VNRKQVGSFAAALTFAASLAASPVPAQAQAPAAPPPPPPRHEGAAEVAFVGVTGNASTNTFGLGYEMIARPAPWVFRQRLAFVRNEADGVLTAKSFLYHPRVERTINTRASAFGDYAFFRDRFAGVSSRNSVTGGLALGLVTGDRQTLSADVGAGYLDEHRLTGSDVSSAIYVTGTRYKLKLSETADLGDELALVGTLSNSDDWRLTHTISLTAKITEAVSLKVSNGVRYSHFPAPGFKTTDTITSIALVARFKRP
jgi:putative salt-induced outer membrane protein